MGKYYDAGKIALHRKVIAACENIAAKPCREFASEIDEMISEIKGLEVNGWSDSAETSFVSAREETLSSLKKISSSINSLFTTGEKTYNLLNEQLEVLKQADFNYSEHLRKEPNKDDYQEPLYTQGYVLTGHKTKSEYYTLHADWKEKKGQLEQQCTSMIENIDTYKATLEQINGAGLDGVSINFGGLPGVIGFEEIIFDYTPSSLEDNTTFIVGGIELQYLTEEELAEFQGDDDEYSRITKGENIVMAKTTRVVDGVEFHVYYVFDNNELSTQESFVTHSNDFFETLAKLGNKSLNDIKDWGTRYIFCQTPDCETNSKKEGKFWCGAYYWGATRDITMFDTYDTYGKQYYEECALHETGHALDDAISNNLGCDNVISHASNFENYPYSFEEVIRMSLQEDLNNNIITQEEIDHFCDPEEIHEYFADVVRRYGLDSELLEREQPMMYDFIVQCLNGEL